MGSARLAAYRDGKGPPSASLATLDLIEPLIVLQSLIIIFLNLGCLEKKGTMWCGRPARALSVLSLAKRYYKDFSATSVPSVVHLFFFPASDSFVP